MSHTKLNVTGGAKDIATYSSDREEAPGTEDKNTLFTKGDKPGSKKEELDKAHEKRPSLRGQMRDVNTGMNQHPADDSQDMLGHYQQMHQNAHNDHSADSAVQTNMASAADAPKSNKLENPYFDTETLLLVEGFEFIENKADAIKELDDAEMKSLINDPDCTPTDDESLPEMAEKGKAFIKRMHHELSSLAEDVNARKDSLRQFIQSKQKALHDLGDAGTPDALKKARALQESIDGARGLIHDIEETCSELDGIPAGLHIFIQNGAKPAQITLLCNESHIDQEIGNLKNMLNRSVLHEAGIHNTDDAKAERFVSIAKLPKQEISEKYKKFRARLQHDLDTIADEAKRQMRDLRKDVKDQKTAYEEYAALDSASPGHTFAEAMDIKRAAIEAYEDSEANYSRLYHELDDLRTDMKDSREAGGSKLQVLHDFPDQFNKVLSECKDLLKIQEWPPIDIYDNHNLDWRTPPSGV